MGRVSVPRGVMMLGISVGSVDRQFTPLLAALRLLV